MDRDHGLGTVGAGFWVKFVNLLIILLLVSSCAPPSNKAEEELRGEIAELRKEIKALGEKIDKLEAGQQSLLTAPKPAAHPPEIIVAPPPQPQQSQPPAAPAPLTVGQLLTNKEKYIGARVTVKGEAGTVMVHHKSLMLKSPQGMVEVLFGKLPDPKQVQRLSATPIDQPLTVTGMVNLPPASAGAAKLQISAESID
jgi:hypothetical protein